MIYNYILVVLRLFVGILTNKILIITALAGLGIYLLWVLLAVAFSFGRKFYKRCDKLTKFVNNNERSDENFDIIMEKSRKISSGLFAGIKTFKRNGTGFPSNYISKSNALDSEVTGGIFNHGKSFMRAYILVSSLFILLMNFAYLGADKPLTGTLIAEIAMLPFIYFVIIRLFYFLYTSTQQQFYKIDVEKFNELVDALDEKYGTKPQNTFAPKTDASEFNAKNNYEDKIYENNLEQETEAEPVLAEAETDKNLAIEENFENETFSTEVENEVVDDLNEQNKEFEQENQVPSVNESEADFIDVNSDFEVKDEHVEADNEFADNQNENISAFEETDNSEKSDLVQVEDESSHNFENLEEDNNPSLSHFDGGDNQTFELNNSNEVTKEAENANSDDNEFNLSGLINMFETEASENDSQNSALQNEKTILENESKNEIGNKPIKEMPIKLERNALPKQNESSQVNNKASNLTKYNQTQNVSNNGFSKMGNFLNFVGSSSDSYGTDLEKPNSRSNFYGGFNGKNDKIANEQSEDLKVSKPIVKKQIVPKSKLTHQINEPIESLNNTQVEVSEQARKQSDVQLNNDTAKTFVPNESVAEPEKINKTIEREPAKLVTEQVFEPKAKPNAIAGTTGSSKGKRGRPTKVVFDENVEIKNDAEFESVLLRAEKLMRKSEEGLSASQSKRVEKELKTLLDAMNRYKETV